MGRIIIGVIFIIGGLSGELVLRGTNSGGALAVVGVILVILGFVQIAKKSGEGDVDSVPTKPLGPKKAFTSVENPLNAINSKAYDATTKYYLGKILEIDVAEKTLKIKTDSGKERIKQFDEIEVLEEELKS